MPSTQLFYGYRLLLSSGISIVVNTKSPFFLFLAVRERSVCCD